MADLAIVGAEHVRRFRGGLSDQGRRFGLDDRQRVALGAILPLEARAIVTALDGAFIAIGAGGPIVLESIAL